jgi:diadenylate cyclase
MFKIISDLQTYTRGWSLLGIIRLFLDLALSSSFFVILYRLIRKRMKGYRLLVIILGFFGIYGISYVLDLKIFLIILEYIIFWSFGALIIIYNQEVKHTLDYFFTSSRSVSLFSSKEEKKEIIMTLCNTADFLSKRRIGALITIEREDSLNVFIEKAIQINGNVTQEILTTIFTPGTACHDGAVIIRKNKVMCAGAYLPSTDKYDIPKFLGTRHRAAIGISEKTDALTIVVSEETGYISITIDGIINLNLSIERVREMLDTHLLNK